MRTSVPPSHPLGRIIWEFRGAFHLSREAVAEALGVGISTIQGWEKGEDPKTHAPPNPREATLEMVAKRMHLHAKHVGQPLAESQADTLRRLLTAAGKDAPVSLRPVVVVMDERDTNAPPLTVLRGLKPDHPPTAAELATLAEVEKIPGLAFPQLTEPGFWSESPEERRETFLLIEQAVERAKRFYKIHGKKPGGRKGDPA